MKDPGGYNSPGPMPETNLNLITLWRAHRVGISLKMTSSLHFSSYLTRQAKAWWSGLARFYDGPRGIAS